MDRPLRIYLIPVLLLLAFTLPHLEQGEFRRDTVRYAAVGLNMWRTGSLLVPYLNSEKPYFNKPPMAFWIHGLALKMFGPRLAAARIPSILAAIGVVVFSMLAVRNLATQREAIVSGIVLASTYEFFRRTREISLDFWQLFFVMIAVWLITKAIREDSRRFVIFSGIPIGFALLCKPLVALFPLLIFAAWLLTSGRKRLVAWLFLGALPVAVIVAAPWHLYMYSVFGEKFVSAYFVREIAARAMRTDQASSIFYYLNQNIFTYWPWMIAVGWSACLWTRQKREVGREVLPLSGKLQEGHNFDELAGAYSVEPLILLATIWVVTVFVALSLFADRKPNYALPLYPMLSWVAAWGLCRIPWPKLNRWFERGFPWLIPVTAILFLIFAIAPIGFQRPPEENWVALVNWLNSNRIDVSRVGYTSAIDQNDVSYVYLKTGQWMQKLETARARNDSSELLIVTKFSAGKANPDQPVLFASGPVHVISEKR